MIGKILKLRQILARYGELYFLMYIALMGGLVSAGFNSSHRVYMVVFVIASLCWVLKMAVTDFSLKEIIIIFIMFLLLAVVFLNNREKTLLLTVMAICAAKGTDLKRVLKYCLYIKITTSAFTMLLASLDIIENVLKVNSKGSKQVLNYCLGYTHPNMAFLNAFTIIMLVVLIWYESLKWYHYLLLTAMMYAAYVLWACRTGFMVWIGVIVLVLIDKFLRNKKINEIWMKLCGLTPLIMWAVSFLFMELYKRRVAIAVKADKILHERFKRPANFIGKHKIGLFGMDKAGGFDNGYIQLSANYGFLIAFLFIAALTACLFYYAYKKESGKVIFLVATAVYLFMEHAQMSSAWNAGIIILSVLLFEPGVIEAFKKKQCD